jgi:hypothetical protein
MYDESLITNWLGRVVEHQDYRPAAAYPSPLSSQPYPQQQQQQQQPDHL